MLDIYICIYIDTPKLTTVPPGTTASARELAQGCDRFRGPRYLDKGEGTKFGEDVTGKILPCLSEKWVFQDRCPLPCRDAGAAKNYRTAMPIIRRAGRVVYR